MRKWMILLAAVLMLLVGCGKEPAVAGLSNEEFHQSFAEDYARPVSNITEITEENGGLMLKTVFIRMNAFCCTRIAARLR